VKVQSKYFGLQNFATWTAHSAFWTAQNWLDCTVRICPDAHIQTHAGIAIPGPIFTSGLCRDRDNAELNVELN